MQRLVPLSLALLVLAGCFSSGGRKDYLEGQLPALVTQNLEATKGASKTGSSECQSVDLILDAPGHYVGKAHLGDGTQRKITVDDEGNKFHFELAPAN